MPSICDPRVPSLMRLQKCIRLILLRVTSCLRTKDKIYRQGIYIDISARLLIGIQLQHCRERQIFNDSGGEIIDEISQGELT